MPADKFDSLVAGAKAGCRGSRPSEPPRLIRARHRARFRSGVLAGRSEFVIEAARTGPADFVLEPWTPAVLATPRTAKVLGARDSGKPSLWIDQSPQPDRRDRLGIATAIAAGRAEFRAGAARQRNNRSDARGPQGAWVPSCRRGRRRGPLSSSGGPDQNVWEIERNPVKSTSTSTTRPGRLARGTDTWAFGVNADRPAPGGRSRGRAWSTGRRNGGSSSTLEIRGRWKSSSTRAWS